jgi:hypothetical protein
MAIDTTHIAYTTEDLIAHKLQRAGLLVAKPKFDQQGADLLAMLEMNDLARACRIQCKGRSLINRDRTEVAIPGSYISDGFVVFVFVETGDHDTTNLFCFLPNEVVKQWTLRESQSEYVLAIYRERLDELKPYEFTELRADEEREQVRMLLSKTIHSLTVTVCDTATIRLGEQVFVHDVTGRDEL